MNTLSWLLYLGDISGSLSSFFAWISAAILIAFTVLAIGGMIESNEHNETAATTLFAYAFKGMLPLFFALAVLACILPSKETVYLIAASEAGETVVKSETGKKALDAINRYLDGVGSTPAEPAEHTHNTSD